MRPVAAVSAALEGAAMKRPPMPVRFEPAPPCVVVAAAPLVRLDRFKRLMADDGRPVDLGRMCLDRRYAHDLLVMAHHSASDALRELAVMLFADYETVPPSRFTLQ